MSSWLSQTMPAKADGELSRARSFAPTKRFESMMIRSIKCHQKCNFVSPESRIHGIAEIRKCENEALTLKSPLPKGASERTKSPMGQMLCCGSGNDKYSDISVDF